MPIQIVIDRPPAPEPTITISEIPLNVYREIVAVLRRENFPTHAGDVRAALRQMEKILYDINAGNL